MKKILLAASTVLALTGCNGENTEKEQNIKEKIHKELKMIEGLVKGKIIECIDTKNPSIKLKGYLKNTSVNEFESLAVEEEYSYKRNDGSRKFLYIVDESSVEINKGGLMKFNRYGFSGNECKLTN